MNEIYMWKQIYQEFYESVGKEATLKIYQTYSGNQISFPKRLLKPQYEYEQIMEEYRSGLTITDLAIRHQYSERTIYRIVNRSKGSRNTFNL